MTGRPPIYTPELAAEICERLAQGETLAAICALPGMPSHTTVWKWVTRNTDGFADAYARAREKGLDAMAEELLGIADDGRNDFVERKNDNGGSIVVADHEHIQRSRLRVDTRKWYLSKLAPKRFGDRTAVEVSGNLNLMGVLAAASIEELEAARAKLIAEHDAGSDLV